MVQRGLQVAALGFPGRATAKPLGFAHGRRRGELLGLSVADARMHCHVLGPTGVGKSTFECNLVVAEAYAGRGVVLLDPQGDLADAVVERLPDWCARRLVVIDPAEQEAPPAWNPLQPPIHHAGGSEGWGRFGRELAVENVVGVFRGLYAGFWGPRMEDTLRAACLTLLARGSATLADVVPLLTDETFRRRVLSEVAEVPAGLEGFWSGWEQMSPGARASACGPLVARLRAVFTRGFARDLLGAHRASFDLGQVLDGGVLIARLPKGELGSDCTRLVGALLLAGLWQATTARAARPAAERADATIVIDECHNFLHLPIGIDEALAESRGYRVSWVLAHQHLDQLSGEVRAAVEANARNKLYFTLAPTDAAKLVRHVAPWFDEQDLTRRPPYQITCRTLQDGRPLPTFSVDAPAPLPAHPGRATQLRAAARLCAGLDRTERDNSQAGSRLGARDGGTDMQQPHRPHNTTADPPPEPTATSHPAGDADVHADGFSGVRSGECSSSAHPGPSVGPSLGCSLGCLDQPSEQPTHPVPKSRVSGRVSGW
jgi:hypothetical protein